MILSLLSSFLELGSRACWKPEETAVTIDFLTRKLEGWGYQVVRESLDLPRYPGNANLIAEKVGPSEPDQLLEIGAHFGSVGNLGADDNGSGVIGVLEVALEGRDLLLGSRLDAYRIFPRGALHSPRIVNGAL